jgi:transcription termination factor NusA
MLAHADIILTARAGLLLVGVARALTDFSYCTYLADLAVDELVDITGQSEEEAKILILKAREHWFTGQA